MSMIYLVGAFCSLCIAASTIGIGSSCALPEVRARDADLVDAVSTVYRESDSSIDWEKASIMISGRDISGVLELRIAVLYKDNYVPLMRHSNSMPWAYFCFGDIPVFVFGSGTMKLFEFTGRENTFEFMSTQHPQESNDIPPPPIIIEPEVWVYNWKGGEMIFLERGLFGFYW